MSENVNNNKKTNGNETCGDQVCDQVLKICDPVQPDDSVKQSYMYKLLRLPSKRLTGDISILCKNQRVVHVSQMIWSPTGDPETDLTVGLYHCFSQHSYENVCLCLDYLYDHSIELKDEQLSYSSLCQLWRSANRMQIQSLAQQIYSEIRKRFPNSPLPVRLIRTQTQKETKSIATQFPEPLDTCDENEPEPDTQPAVSIPVTVPQSESESHPHPPPEAAVIEPEPQVPNDVSRPEPMDDTDAPVAQNARTESDADAEKSQEPSTVTMRISDEPQRRDLTNAPVEQVKAKEAVSEPSEVTPASNAGPEKILPEKRSATDQSPEASAAKKSKSDKEMFACETCHKEFALTIALKKHITKAHSNDKKFNDEAQKAQDTVTQEQNSTSHGDSGSKDETLAPTPAMTQASDEPAPAPTVPTTKESEPKRSAAPLTADEKRCADQRERLARYIEPLRKAIDRMKQNTSPSSSVSKMKRMLDCITSSPNVEAPSPVLEYELLVKYEKELGDYRFSPSVSPPPPHEPEPTYENVSNPETKLEEKRQKLVHYIEHLHYWIKQEESKPRKRTPLIQMMQKNLSIISNPYVAKPGEGLCLQVEMDILRETEELLAEWKEKFGPAPGVSSSRKQSSRRQSSSSNEPEPAAKTTKRGPGRPPKRPSTDSDASKESSSAKKHTSSSLPTDRPKTQEQNDAGKKSTPAAQTTSKAPAAKRTEPEKDGGTKDQRSTHQPKEPTPKKTEPGRDNGTRDQRSTSQPPKPTTPAKTNQSKGTDVPDLVDEEIPPRSTTQSFSTPKSRPIIVSRSGPQSAPAPQSKSQTEKPANGIPTHKLSIRIPSSVPTKTNPIQSSAASSSPNMSENIKKCVYLINRVLMFASQKDTEYKTCLFRNSANNRIYRMIVSTSPCEHLSV